MTNLHAHIMSIIKNNNVTQDTKQANPNSERFRLSPTTLGITLSDELLAQLDRYCEDNPTTPQPTKLKPNPQPRPTTRSKAIRKAVYALMENPNQLQNPPSRLPTVALPPERSNNVSWTMPTKKLADTQHLHNLCTHYGVKQFVFTRRAIYLYTKEYASADRTEADTAAKDAWF